jgi:hypothetical protein
MLTGPPCIPVPFRGHCHQLAIVGDHEALRLDDFAVFMAAISSVVIDPSDRSGVQCGISGPCYTARGTVQAGVL